MPESPWPPKRIDALRYKHGMTVAELGPGPWVEEYHPPVLMACKLFDILFEELEKE